MGDNRSELPEGTDTIITGASNPITGPAAGGAASGAGAASEGGGEDIVVTETVTVTTTEEPASGAGGSAASAGGGGSAGLADRLRSGGGKLSGQAADKARGLLSQGLERSAEALANVGRLVGDTATGLEERLGPEYGDYARRAAGAIESTANNIASKDADELIDDTRNFVRKSPGVALAGAAIVGFAVARLIKTGLNERDDDDGDDRRA